MSDQGQTSEAPEAPVERLRDQLLSAMSAVSEDMWAAGWMSGLDETLWAVGGIWEIIGREIGWPLGYRAEGGWLDWDEAGKRYSLAIEARRAAQAS